MPNADLQALAQVPKATTGKRKINTLRWLSWLCVALSPWLILAANWLYYAFQPRQWSCAGWWQCTVQGAQWGVELLIMLVVEYFACLLCAAVLNVLDYVRHRRTASRLRVVELVLLTLPIWAWVFAVPGQLRSAWHEHEKAPFVPVLQAVHTTRMPYAELAAAVAKLDSAPASVRNDLPNFSWALSDARLRLQQLEQLRAQHAHPLPADQDVAPIRLCFHMQPQPVDGVEWRLIAWQNVEDYDVFEALGTREALAHGVTQHDGCSALVNTSPLATALRAGHTLLLIENSQVWFLTSSAPDFQLRPVADVSSSSLALVLTALPPNYAQTLSARGKKGASSKRVTPESGTGGENKYP